MILPFIILFKERPPTPPSFSANLKKMPPKILKDTLTLLKNKNYLIIVMIYTLIHANYTSMGAAISFITKPYGFTNSDNA